MLIPKLLEEKQTSHLLLSDSFFRILIYATLCPVNNLFRCSSMTLLRFTFLIKRLTSFIKKEASLLLQRMRVDFLFILLFQSSVTFFIVYIPIESMRSIPLYYLAAMSTIRSIVLEPSTN